MLSTPAKVFETIIFKYIYSTVRSSISIHQHGFVKSRSTVSNLISVTQNISEVLDRRGQVDIVYTDFEKAFDKISFVILLDKLDKEFGFHNNLVEFLRSYLYSRVHRVTLKGYKSNLFYPTSGIPQGSNLGPLLFLLYIDSIALVKLYYEIRSIEDCITLQRDIDKLTTWSIENKLYFNVNKCVVLSYTRKIRTIFDYSISNVCYTCQGK